jgi:hypothetical protein
VALPSNLSSLSTFFETQPNNIFTILQSFSCVEYSFHNGLLTETTINNVVVPTYFLLHVDIDSRRVECWRSGTHSANHFSKTRVERRSKIIEASSFGIFLLMNDNCWHFCLLCVHMTGPRTYCLFLMARMGAGHLISLCSGSGMRAIKRASLVALFDSIWMRWNRNGRRDVGLFMKHGVGW